MKSKLKQKGITKQQPQCLIYFLQGINTKSLASHGNEVTKKKENENASP